MPSGEVIALPPFFQEESTQFTDLDPCLVVPVPFGCSPLCSMDESQQYNLRSCIDPFTYTGYDPELFQPLSQSYPNLIDQEVVDWFKKEHICCKSTFRLATCEDIPTLTKLNHINSKYNKAEYYKELFALPNHFLLVVERDNSNGEQVLVGMAHYYFAACESKPKYGKSEGDCQVVGKKEPNMEERVVYISELQVNQNKNTKRNNRNLGMESEPDTCKVVFSLICEHGRRAGMRWVLVDSSFSNVAYYQQILGMIVTSSKDVGKYSMQLSLLHSNYKLYTNVYAKQGATKQSKNAGALKDADRPKCEAKCCRDKYGRFTKAKDNVAEEASDCISRSEGNAGTGSGDGDGTGAGSRSRSRNRNRNRNRNRSRSRNEKTRKFEWLLCDF